MKVKLQTNVKELDQLNYTVTIPKHVIVRLLDYFELNTDGRPYFDGDGQLDGVDGVPPAFIDLIASILDVYMDAKDWEVVISHVRSGYTRDRVIDEVKSLLEEKGLGTECFVNARAITERDV